MDSHGKSLSMSKRRKSNSDYLIETLFMIIQSIIVLFIRFIIFSFDLITFYTTKYKEKSGNSFFKTYFDKGNYGEFSLYRKLIPVFGKNALLTNIYLDNKNTETTEIDVLAISSQGIYVFEMKNYAGYIYGSQTDQYWTQAFSKRTKNKFYNPLRQNYAHTKAVQNYLGIDEKLIIPVIVFSNRSKLSKIKIDKNTNVFQYRNAIKFVKKHEKSKNARINLESKETYLVKLIEKCNMTNDVKQKHIDSINQMIMNKN